MNGHSTLFLSLPRAVIVLVFAFGATAFADVITLVDVSVLQFRAPHFEKIGDDTFHASGEIEVGFVPGENEAFQPLIALSNGVRIKKQANDNSFTTSGAVYAVSNNRQFLLYQGALTVPVDRIIDKGINVSKRKVTIGGAALEFTSIALVPAGQEGATTSEVRLQGSFGIPKLAGLSIAVDGKNYVSINRNGARINGAGFAVSRSFSIGGLQVKADNVKVAYSHPSNTFELTGSFSLPQLWSATAAFPGRGLEIVNGQVKLHGLRIAVSDVYLHAFNLKEIEVTYTDDERGTRIGCKVDVEIPSMFAVAGELKIVNGRPTSIALAFKTDNPQLMIPIGDTGLFLNEIGGGVGNLDKIKDIEITLTAGVQATNINTALAPFSARGTMTVSRNGLKLVGDCSFLTGDGNVEIDLNWRDGKYWVHIAADLSLGVYRVEADVKVNRDGDFSVAGKAVVQVPKKLPFIGGKRFANIDFYLQVRKKNPQQDFAAAWVKLNLILWTPEVGVKHAWNQDPPFRLIGASEIADIGREEKKTEMEVDKDTQVVRRVYYYPVRCAVPKGATSAMLTATWPQPAPDGRFELTLPDGKKIEQKDFLPRTNGIQLVAGYSSPTSATVSVINPQAKGNPYISIAAGTYTLTMITTADMPNEQMEFKAHYEVPDPELVANSVELQGAVATIAYTFRTGFPQETQVDWYLAWQDTDGKPAGLLLTEMQPDGEVKSQPPQPGVPATRKFRFEISRFLPLKYIVYGIVNDGVNAPVTSNQLKFEPTPALSGFVTDEANENQTGWTVSLGDGTSSKPTSANGFWGFSHLDPGTYTLSVDLIEGWAMLPPSTRTRTIRVAGPQQNVVEEFRVQKLATISGRVFEDLNRSGKYDSGDRPLQHRIVYLQMDDDNSFDLGNNFATTDVDGIYNFQVPFGRTYHLRMMQRLDWEQTFPFNAGAHAVKISRSGQVVTGQDFGVLNYGRIGGLVYQDTAGDVNWDSCDGPATNLSVVLTSLGDKESRAQRSNSDGNYLFAGLYPGRYKVSLETPDGWRLSHPRMPVFNGFGASKRAVADQVQKANNLACGDFNGDTHVDIAFTANGSGKVTWLAGDGKGSFHPGGQIEAITEALPPTFETPQVVSGDIDLDGDTDLLVWAGWFSVLRNDGRGRFSVTQLSRTVDATQSHSQNFVLADLDQDDRPDVVFAGQGTDRGIHWMKNQTETFAAATLLVRATGTKWLAAADFNADGMIDLAYCDDESQADAFGAINKGNGSFAAPNACGVGPSGKRVGLAAADLNGDGAVDLVVGRADRAATFLNDARGQFRVGTNVNRSLKHLVAGDMSGSGHASLVDPVSGIYYDNSSDGNVTFKRKLLFGEFAGANGTLADLNHDGVLDLVAAGSDLFVWLGKATYRHDYEITLRPGEEVQGSFGIFKDPIE